MDLETLYQMNEGRLPMMRIIEEFEKQAIEFAHQKSGGSRTEAAKILGLLRTTLTEKMRKYGFKLNPPAKRKKFKNMYSCRRTK